MAEDAVDKTVVTVISRVARRPVAREACLVVIYGEGLGKKHSLDGPTAFVGRSSKSDIQIDQESVSRSHCKLVCRDDTVILHDLGSTNGTYVNDAPVKERVLVDGDIIKVGRTILKFLSRTNIEQAYHEEIYRMTTVDGLTEVYNRGYFLEALEREVSRSQRYGRHLSLLLFDVDHFKGVNDEYGHLAGDYVLKQLAAVVKRRIRREDVMARYGGEEFAVLLPEIDAAGARRFADKALQMVQRASFVFEKTTIQVTVSIGVASLNNEKVSPEELIKRADAKLYEAKRQGRNRVCS